MSPYGYPTRPPWQPRRSPPTSSLTGRLPQHPVPTRYLGRTSPQLAVNLVAVTNLFSVEFFPDADPEQTTVDGYTEHLDAAGLDWSVIRSAAGNGADDSGSELIVEVESDTATDKWDLIRRAVIVFDPTIIPTDANVVAGGVEWETGTSIVNDFGGSLVLCEASPASDTQLVAGDYDAFGSVEYGDNRITIASLSGAVGATFRLNDDGLDYVTRQVRAGDLVRLGVRLNHDFDNIEPTWASFNKDEVTIISSDTVGRAPRLRLLYNRQ